jgi:hypothetical protein
LLADRIRRATGDVEDFHIRTWRCQFFGQFMAANARHEVGDHEVNMMRILEGTQECLAVEPSFQNDISLALSKIWRNKVRMDSSSSTIKIVFASRLLICSAPPPGAPDIPTSVRLAHAWTRTIPGSSLSAWTDKKKRMFPIVGGQRGLVLCVGTGGGFLAGALSRLIVAIPCQDRVK